MCISVTVNIIIIFVCFPAGKSTQEKQSAKASHDGKEESGSVNSIERLLDKVQKNYLLFK